MGVGRSLSYVKYFRSILRHRNDSRKLIRNRFERIHGKPLNVDQPATFTEKLNARLIRMLDERRPAFTDFADKLRVRKYVADVTSTDYLSNIFWAGKDLNSLGQKVIPERFALKANHGSGFVAPVEGYHQGFDVNANQEILNHWLKTNFYWEARELQYFYISPLGYIEEWLEDVNEVPLYDYRFYVFRGKIALIQVDNPSHTINSFFDTDWQLINLWYRPEVPRPSLAPPENLDEMMSVASKLAKQFSFVRVDLYSINRKIVFSEMTFTPTAGTLVFNDSYWDQLLGDLWSAPD